MRDPNRWEEEVLKGDRVNRDHTFAPSHCEECGRKASEYFRIQYMTVCESCLRPSDRSTLRKRK